MNTTNNMTTKKVILAKSADWDAWLSFVRTWAVNTQIWDLVSPDLEERPVSVEQPIEPEFTVPDDDAQFDKVKYEAYKARKDVYKTKLARYERQEKAFGDLITFIQETIAAHNDIFIQKKEPHPWNILQALKQRLAPSDEARNLAIEQRYHNLCKGPETQSIETWLNDWVTTYSDGIEHGIAETTGTRINSIFSHGSSIARCLICWCTSCVNQIPFKYLWFLWSYWRLQTAHSSSTGSTTNQGQLTLGFFNWIKFKGPFISRSTSRIS